MTRRLPLLAVLPAAIALAVPAFAQDAGSDVRCFVVSNVFANNPSGDDQHKKLSQATGLFFLGRTDARLSAAQLKAQIVAQQKTLNAQNAGQIMTDCARRFTAKQQELATIGKELAAANPPPAGAAPAPAPAAPPKK